MGKGKACDNHRNKSATNSNLIIIIPSRKIDVKYHSKLVNSVKLDSLINISRVVSFGVSQTLTFQRFVCHFKTFC